MEGVLDDKLKGPAAVIVAKSVDAACESADTKLLGVMVKGYCQ